mmetsp:Transcript_6081/g.8684  ORF Transcript_6081/g.8684 Transcript_6081/m.8684 type:complete len:568 (-) Transcript_6081:1309-3012(-)
MRRHGNKRRRRACETPTSMPKPRNERMSERVNLCRGLYHRETGSLQNPFHLCGRKGKQPAQTSCWYNFARKSIPFAALETSGSDAVLAIDRTGSFLISIGKARHKISTSDGEDIQSLAIHFHAMPSPSSLVGTRNNDRHYNVSPHFCTIPLITESCNGDDSFFNLAAITPVQILLSSDGAVGAAFVQRSEQNESAIVIFPSPSNHLNQEHVKVFNLPNARIGAVNTHTLRNLLWKTHLIPNKSLGSFQRNSNRIKKLGNKAGYLFFNDEDDGWRIFWIAYNVEDLDCEITEQKSQQKCEAVRSDIIQPCDGSEIDVSWINVSSGITNKNLPEQNKQSGEELSIAFEAYLNIEALLCEILLNRKHLVTTKDSPELKRSPEYFYSLISYGANDERSINLVVVFSNPRYEKVKAKCSSNQRNKKASVPASYGVYVTLDLFDQSYSEGDWVMNSTKHDPAFLRRWANKLAVNRRMREMKVGPHSADPDYRKFLGVNLHEQNREEFLDYDSLFWNPFAKKDGKQAVALPKTIAMSSLYPSCDVITNSPVISGLPVGAIECRDFPVSLMYENT